MPRLRRVVSLLAVVLVLVRCATAPPVQVRPRAEPIVPAATGSQPSVSAVRDDVWLFHAASEAERDGDDARARAYYDELLRERPNSDLVDAARFNLGLTFEHAGDFAKAADTYSPIIERPVTADGEARRTWLDAHFRRAACLSKSGAWLEVSRLFDTVLSLPALDRADRVEALVGRGIADRERGDARAAEISFSEVLHLARGAGRDTALDDFAAEAAFHWGELDRSRFEEVALAFPNALLAKRLEEKCERLMNAQRRYLRAMSFGDAHTVAAGGNRIGGMYESLYDALMALETPPDFDQEQRAVYRDEVKKRLRVLAEKAIRVYERTALVGKRTDSAAPWVQKSEAALTRLRAIVLDDDVLDNESR